MDYAGGFDYEKSKGCTSNGVGMEIVPLDSHCCENYIHQLFLSLGRQ